MGGFNLLYFSYVLELLDFLEFYFQLNSKNVRNYQVQSMIFLVCFQESGNAIYVFYFGDHDYAISFEE